MPTSHSTSRPADCLQGKVSLFTGASSSIGRAAAFELAARAARMVVSTRRAERLNALVAQITQQDGEARAIAVDVTDRAQIIERMAFTQREDGCPDSASNNAGAKGELAALKRYPRDGQEMAKIVALPASDDDRFTFGHSRLADGGYSVA
jgi:NADP-dependent 3-hydroxy acid dehydrogenase YdfG